MNWGDVYTTNHTRSYRIGLDPSYDLRDANVCNCKECCEQYWAAYCESANELADELSAEITIIWCTYNGIGDPGGEDTDNIWQKLHDMTSLPDCEVNQW